LRSALPHGAVSPGLEGLMRILHVITALDTGGAERMLLKLLSASQGEHCQAVVSLKDDGTIGAQIRKLGIAVYGLGLRRNFPNPLSALSILPALRHFRPDLVQGWMYHGNIAASLAGKLARSLAPVVWNIRQSLSDLADQRRLTRAVIRLGATMSRFPAAVIYNSDSGARQHATYGYRPVRHEIIPNGFDCSEFCPNDDAYRQFRSELAVQDDAILIGIVARYHPVKDHAGFLRAARLVAREHPQTRFVLVGPGVNQEQPVLSRTIAEYELQDRIFMLGERFDMPRLTAALDIACSASWAEGFSNTIGEAMCCGVPCVVTDVGDSAHIVGDTGLCVPPRNPQAFANAIGQLIGSGATQRRDLGVAARRRIVKEFSLSAIWHRYETLYHELSTCEKACR